MKLGNRTGLLNTKQLYISYEIRKEIIRNAKKYHIYIYKLSTIPATAKILHMFTQ